MAFYVVKSISGTDAGTATGDGGRYASNPASSFAALGLANYYPSLKTLVATITTPLASGDIVLTSDLHEELVSGGGSFIFPTDGVIYVAVDDSDMSQGRTSGNFAQAGQTDNTNDVSFPDMCILSGFEIRSGDDVIFQSPTGTMFIDGILRVAALNDTLKTSGDGSTISIINSELKLDDAGCFINNSGGASFDVTGGSVTTTSAGITNLFSTGATNGGMSAVFSGVDLSSVVGTLVANVGGDLVVDDGINMLFNMCKLASGVAFTNEAFKSYNQRALFTRCSDSSAAAEYQYHLHAFGGDVDDDSAIFRNEDPAFEDSGQKVSYKITTNSDASLGSPLWFDFPIDTWSELSTAANTLRLHITSNETLDNKKLYIEVSYPNGTNKQTPVFLSSAPLTVGGTLDLMAAGTTLTTDGSSTWTGALSNLYIIDLQLASGADTVPIVKVYCTEPSVTIQIAAKPEMV